MLDYIDRKCKYILKFTIKIIRTRASRIVTILLMNTIDHHQKSVGLKTIFYEIQANVYNYIVKK